MSQDISSLEFIGSVIPGLSNSGTARLSHAAYQFFTGPIELTGLQFHLHNDASVGQRGTQPYWRHPGVGFSQSPCLASRQIRNRKEFSAMSPDEAALADHLEHLSSKLWGCSNLISTSAAALVGQREATCNKAVTLQ